MKTLFVNYCKGRGNTIFEVLNEILMSDFRYYSYHLLR